MNIGEFLQKQKWIFAKTYAEFAPHEYIVKGKNGVSEEEFTKVAQFILDHGIRMFYYKNERKYLYLDGYFYWIMDATVTDKTTVINRCKPEDYDIVFMRRGTNKK